MKLVLKSNRFLMCLKVLIAILIFIATVELLSRAYFEKMVNFSYAAVYRQAEIQLKIFEEHPFLLGSPKASITEKIQLVDSDRIMEITHSKFHTRGNYYSVSGKNHVFGMVGGSIVYGTALNDQETWPSVFFEKTNRRYTVYNFGVPGYSTLENIIQTATVLPDLKVSHAIFLIGYNDAQSAYIKNLEADYSDFHGKLQFQLFRGFFRNFPNLSRSAAMFFLASAFESRQYLYQSPSQIALNVGISRSELAINRGLGVYENNIKSLIYLCRAHGIVPIFVPQTLSPDKYSYARSGIYWIAGVNSQEEIGELVKLYNLQLKKITTNEKALYADLLDVKYSNEDFVDVVHFSPTGVKKFVQALVSYLNRVGTIKIE